MTENELYDYIVKKAGDFGMKPINNSKATREIKNKGGNAVIRHNTAKDPYFAFIGKEEETSGPYNGLSFVIFPNAVEDNTVNSIVMSIGIGSATLGTDTALAYSPGLRRSFMKLIYDPKGNAQFFFAENWDNMETRTPGLKEAVKATGDETLISSIKNYDDNSQKNREGLLPAAALLSFDKEFDPNKQGISVLDAWLAQYAKWRTWSSNQTILPKIEDAINKARIPSKNNATIQKEVEELVEKRKYIVLQGAPGCGKTRMALEYAAKFDPKNVTFIQFHAETTYADFVYGIKPTLNGKDVGYIGVKGALLEAIEKAEEAKKEGKPALLIIDEINRANLANVLGPVFYLFEANAQNHNYSLNLGSIEQSKDDHDHSKEIKKLEYSKLPVNLYVIATMNTADRSLAVVDFALRRRFSWYSLYPKSLEEEDLNGKYFDSIRYNEFNDLFEKYATDDELNLQPGHSYFILDTKPDESENISEEMKFRLKYELMPLMKEYFNESFLLSAKEEFSHLFFKYTGEYMYK